MIPTADIAHVLVTRGDVDIAQIKDASPFDEIIVWDNSRRPFDAKVFGRYLAILETDRPVVAVQDDDCVVCCWDQLRAHYEPGKIVANMVGGHRAGEPPMLGWGALFDRGLPWVAFERWFAAGFELDWQMTGYPETIFTALVPYVRLNIGSHADPDSKGHVDLPWATDASRSYQQPNHYSNFSLVLERALAVAAGKRATTDIRRDELDVILSRVDRDLARV